MRASRLLLLACVLTAASALAETPGGAPRFFRPLSITVSPLWLPFAMANGTVEYQPSRRWGTALKGHYGIFNMGDADPGTFDLFSGEIEARMAGGELRFYPFANALHLAGGATWFQLRHREANQSSQKSSGWMANGLMGVKGVARSGLTLDAQVGVGLNVPDVGMRWGQDLGPLVRFNLGWSFRPLAFAR